MLSTIQAVISVFALFALSRAALRWRDRSIGIFEFLLWTGVWTVLLVLVFVPDVTTIISRWWGISRGIDSILYASIIALFYLVFRLYAKLDPRRQEITGIVRYLAIAQAKRGGRPVTASGALPHRLARVVLPGKDKPFK